MTAFMVLSCLRVLLYKEIKRYKSPIRIRIAQSVLSVHVVGIKMKYSLPVYKYITFFYIFVQDFFFFETQKNNNNN